MTAAHASRDHDNSRFLNGLRNELFCLGIMLLGVALLWMDRLWYPQFIKGRRCGCVWARLQERAWVYRALAHSNSAAAYRINL